MAHSMQNTFERRLRPIYDNLEVGNNRKALQETDKLLKKHPNLLCGRALKGLALLKLGRFEESHNYLESVTNEKPIDEPTLQVLTFCYKELEQFDKIVDLFNHAVKQSPGNEELLAHLFISYVRLEDFKSQQSVALQLYKTAPKSSYYFWSVISTVLQATRGPEKDNPDKKRIFLTLAQRMTDKVIEENKLESEQEALLYLRILKLQSKHKEALEFYETPICQQLCPEATEMKIELMKNLDMWQEINIELKKLLLKDLDRWDYHKDFIKSCLILQKNYLVDSELTENHQNVDHLQECYDFINQLIKSSNQKIRGPYLARLELYRSVRVNKLQTQCLKDDFFDLICEYYQLFGDKPCCTQDVTLFLHDISTTERKDLACRLMNNCKVSNTSLPENKSDMQKHICALQLSRICGTHINFEDVHLLALYTSLKLHYEHGQSLFGNKLLPTELGPSDPYVLLAANVMYDVSVRGKQSKSLFEALCLLQYVLRNSPSNFHVMLASLKIFHMFGCLVGAQEMYEYLDIKQIQLDSMGFIHCNLLPMCGRFTVTRMIFDTTLKFFTTSYKERLEYVAMVYRFCTFTKLEEFMNFKDRLMTSMHYAMISVEAQICDLVTLYNNVQQNLSVFAAMNIDPNEERINWTRLSDNRDLTAITRWEPLCLVNLERERAESFTQEKEVLQMRLLLLRLIASFVDLMIPSTRKKLGNTIINNMMESTTTNNCKEFETVEHILSLWTAYFKRVRALNYTPLSNEFLANLLPTRLHLLLDLPYEKFFTDVAILILQLYNGESSLVLQCKQVSEHITQIAQLVTQTIEANNNAADDLWIRRHCQTKVAGCLEIMSLYAFILSVCHEKLQSPPKSVKSRKKSNQNQLQNTCNSNENENSIVSEKERMQMLLELMRHLKNKLQHCDSALRTWKSPVLPSDFNTYLNDMSIKPEIETSIICDLSTTFRESHELMVNELRNLMKDKIRMVSKQGLV